MVVLNFLEETKDIETITRYNGGWLKTVKGLDKSKNNGYSIIGEFVQAGDFKQNYAAGLYIDCSKGGSRKNQEFNYHLFKVTDNGFELLMTLENAGRTWAVDLWDAIEENLNKTEEVTAQQIVNNIYEKVGNNAELLTEVIDLLKKQEQRYHVKNEKVSREELEGYLKLNKISKADDSEITAEEEEKLIDELVKTTNLSREEIEVAKSLQDDVNNFKVLNILRKLGALDLPRTEYCDFFSNIQDFKYGYYMFGKNKLIVFKIEGQLLFSEIALH